MGLTDRGRASQQEEISKYLARATDKWVSGLLGYRYQHDIGAEGQVQEIERRRSPARSIQF
jgi:hypothetical protein